MTHQRGDRADRLNVRLSESEDLTDLEKYVTWLKNYHSLYLAESPKPWGGIREYIMLTFGDEAA